MKKFLKITGITVLVILAIIAVLPFAFKGKIADIVKTEINKNLDAKVDFGSFGLNFFKSFPNATVSLDNLTVAGVDEFAADTLFAAKSLSATINLSSLFGNSGYEITKIAADRAQIYAHILENGKVNWDIAKSDDSEQSDTTADAQNFKLVLKDVEVNNSDIVFDDDSSKILFAMNDFNLNLSGNLTAETTNLKIKSNTGSLRLEMDNIAWINGVKFVFNSIIDADLQNMKFTFADNLVKINEIEGSIEGWVEMKETSTDLDLQLNTKEIQFKDILSLIPAVYAADFKDLKTSGEVALTASAKGSLTETTIPQFDATLTVDNGEIKYSSLPETISGITANIRAYNENGLIDNTLLDISKFHFLLSGNPFDLTLHLSHPVTDPDFKLSATGKIDLAALKKAYPMGDTDLSGKFDADLTLASRMSAIEKGQYEKVNAAGTLNISDLVYSSVTTDSITSSDAISKNLQISRASLAFSPQFVELKDFSFITGRNDIEATGRLENFLPYILKNETLKGVLKVSSNYLNLNDFMTDSGTDAASQDSSSIGVIEIPKNIDFTLNGAFKEVIFDNMNMKNVAGQIVVRNGKAEMKDLAMQALGGNIAVNGYYDTGKNPEQPEVSLGLNIRDASFTETFSTFVTVRKLAPIFENLLGNYSTNFTMTAPLGSDFMPVLDALTAQGNLDSKDVQISGSPVLEGLATTLKNESLKNLKVKDLSLPFNISGGRVTTKPFNLSFGDGTMNLQGSTGLDQTIDYSAVVKLSGKLANAYLNNVPVKIGGTFTQPKFTVDAKGAANEVLGNLAGKITGEEGSLTEQATAKANEEIEKQAEKLRTEAKEAGDKLIAEAEKQGQKLIDEANKTSNPLAKVAAVKAAEASAKKLKDEAQKQADKLQQGAEEQIGKLK